MSLLHSSTTISSAIDFSLSFKSHWSQFNSLLSGKSLNFLHIYFIIFFLKNQLKDLFIKFFQFLKDYQPSPSTFGSTKYLFFNLHIYFIIFFLKNQLRNCFYFFTLTLSTELKIHKTIHTSSTSFQLNVIANAPIAYTPKELSNQHNTQTSPAASRKARPQTQIQIIIIAIILYSPYLIIT